jgi:hypothetical protein
MLKNVNFRKYYQLKSGGIIKWLKKYLPGRQLGN